MKWEWMDLVTDYLNPDALVQCRINIAAMSPWVQAVLVGVVFLLAGSALLELMFGLKMQKFARFMTGLSVGFAGCFVILEGYTETEELRLILYALAAGTVLGLLNAFLERAFQFVSGFFFGTAFASWLVPVILHKELTAAPGGILRLIIAFAAGILFALLTNKIRPVLTALLGGTILGLLIESFVSYASIPYLPEVLDLSEGMYRNILPLILAGIGILIQLPQWLTLIRTEKEMKIAAARALELDSGTSGESQSTQPEEADTEKAEESPASPAAVDVAQAEAILVEKARELAQAAARSAEDIRLRERYEDVAQGLYSSEAAAGRLGISEEEFLKGMEENGYSIPGAEKTEEPVEEKPETEASEEAASEQEEPEAEEGIPAEEEPEQEEPEAEEEIPAEEEPEQAEPEAEEEIPAEEEPEQEESEAEEEIPAEEEPEQDDTEETENTEPGEGEADGVIREEDSDLPQEGQTDLGEDQGSSE